MEWDAASCTASLILKHPKTSDSGNYECVAKSSAGTTNSPTKLAVKKPDIIPTVQRHLEKTYTTVEGGKSLRLECQVDGFPSPYVTWIKNGKDVVVGCNVAMEWDPDTGSAALVFKQPTCEDSGDYQCVATSPVGTTNSHTTLTVKKPEKVPSVVEQLDKVYDCQEGGDSVRLTCRMEGNPSPTITWIKDGKKVTPGDNVAMEWDPDTGSAALVFKQPTCEDSGDYQCVATSPVGTTNSHTTLTVKKIPSVVEPLNKAYEPVEGDQNVRLVCKLDGTPAPEVTWLKDGKKLTPGDNVAMEWDPDTGSTALVFKQPTCEDSGDYQCVATSPVGTTNCHTTLTVKKIPTVVEPLNKAYEPVEGDQNVRLVCKLDGTPAPEITWLRDGKKVTPGDNVAMEWDPDTGSAALVFKQPTCEDSGDYQCVATSPVGTTNSHTTLTVKKIPTVVEPLNKASEPVEGDQNVRLVCKLDGTPAPEVTWLRNGKKVTPGDNVAMAWDPDTGSAALVFKQPTCEDSGDYQCVATSPVGTTNSHTTHTVKKIPTVIEQLEKSYDSVEGTDSVTLVCKIDGNPCPEICWWKDGQKIKSGDNVAMEWDQDTGSAALVFKQPTCEDSGDYQCVATSPVGTTNSHTTLTVKKKTKAPGVVRPLDSAYNSTEGGEVVRLVCEVEGNPTPQITWLKDGKEVTPGNNVAMEWDPDTGSAALVFKQPTCEDSGDYQCVATSPMGTTNSHTTLNINKRPTVTKPLEKIYTCKAGDKNVRLVCTVTGKPSPEVSWSKGGKEIKSSGSIKIEWDVITGSAALVFKQPTCPDSGDYQCMASSPLGSTSTSTTLKVKKPEKKPAVVKPLDREYNLTETKEPITLTFKVDGNPVPEVSWVKDGKPLEAGGNISFDWNAETGSASLIFKGVSVKDSGKYECVATSTIGKTTSSTAIVVKTSEPEKKPTFSAPLQKENNKKEGDENFVLTCTVEGNPRPEVSWVKNGEKIAADGNTSVKYDAEKGIATLTLKVLSCADSGNYECVAVSSAGTGKSVAKLTVKMPEIKPKFSKELDEAYNVLVGDNNVKMACVVDGNPCPDVSWFKAGKKEKLMETSNMKMKWTPSTGHADLIFNSISLSDAGTYVCVADSAIGSKKSETTLKVTKRVCPPVFTDMAASQTVPVGGVAVFKGIITSKSPATFTWKKGSAVLSNTDRIKIAVSKTETSLTITGVQFDDRATYTCSAKNEDGEEHTSGDLNVEEKGVRGRWTPFEDEPSKFIAGDEDDVFLPDVQKPKDSYTWDTYVKDITILAEGYPVVIADNIFNDEESVVQHAHSNASNIEPVNEEEEYVVTMTMSSDQDDSTEIMNLDMNNSNGAEYLENGTTESNSSAEATSSVHEEGVRSPTSSVHEEGVRSPTSSVHEEGVRSPTSSVHEEGIRSPTSSVHEEGIRSPTSSVHEERVRSLTSSVHEEGIRSLTSSVHQEGIRSLLIQNQEEDNARSEEMENGFETIEDLETNHGIVRNMDLKEILQGSGTLTTEEDKDCTISGHPESPVKPINFNFLINSGPDEESGEDTYSYEYLSESEEDFTQTLNSAHGKEYIDDARSSDGTLVKDLEKAVPDDRDIELDHGTMIRDLGMVKETVDGDLEEKAEQDVVDGSVESKVSESVKVAETKSEVTATQEVKETKEEVKVTKVTSESVSAAESTVQVLEELETSVTKLNETLSQSQETSVTSSTLDSRIQIVEVTARHVAKETTDLAGAVRHRHHDHHGPEVIIPANSAAIPEHSEVELMVKVRAAKQANVRWMHEGEVVQHSGHYEMLEEEEFIKK
ncbi:hemicentin-1-like isoform X2 [Mizuhopecten yessoensis]|uniref:hemicentin-1-like isoform X2 n=1 Tax=Mizuhopecten yessoensis TaxID=6573 RepID=UPI000B45F41A|nr:hemicentin-1-like isoform X2 [Mizuhopecten yessoensis]